MDSRAVFTDRDRTTGTTYAEVMVALVCFAVVAACAVPSIYGLSQAWNLRGAVELFEVSLLWGRLHAVTANTAMVLIVESGGRCLYWSDPAGARYEESVRCLPAGTRIIAAPSRPLRFYQHGNAAPAGSYVLQGVAGSYRIVVNPGGRIRVQRL
jgi:Tfp pilus assembly protein FimT